LMEEAVIPYLRKKFGIEEVVQYKVLRVCGLGESGVNEQISDLMREGDNPSIGLLASPGDIKIRIMAKGKIPSEAQSLIETMEAEIRGRLGTLIYGVDEETLEGSVIKLLEEMKLTLSTAELFTGGSVAQRLSRTESAQFIQGFVLNTDETTRSFLGIGMGELSEIKGAGGEFVLCLAGRTRDGCRSDVGLSVVGFSQRETPREGGEIRAHIYIGIVSENGGKWADYQLGGTKVILRERAAIITLDTLRKELLNMGKA